MLNALGLRDTAILFRRANIRNNALHEMTTYFTQKYDGVVMEDPNVSGMLKNHKLASAIALHLRCGGAVCGFSEVQQQSESKAKRLRPVSANASSVISNVQESAGYLSREGP
jgi:transposase